MRKVCTVCSIEKNITEFNKNSQTKDGFTCPCKSCLKAYRKQYYVLHKNTTIATAKLRNKENYKLAKRTEKYKEVRNTSRKIRYKNDLSYKLMCVFRSRLKAAIKGNSKNYTTEQTFSCSINKLVKHLESKFQPGMTWENYGQWQIDHIKPISSFDLTNLKQAQEANHYTNLQPLWAEENFKKGAR